MFYRTNDLIHSRRVLWHLEKAIPDILKVYGSNFDIEYARTIALVHNDVKILPGDIPLQDKELEAYVHFEGLSMLNHSTIPTLVNMYSDEANGYSYNSCLVSANEKDTLESQFVSFFDKFDGGGEAWHEIWAGNHHFLLPSGGNHGKEGGYVRRLNEFQSKYQDMKRFFNQFPEYLPKPFDFKSAAERGNIHTESSLQIDSGYPSYERWRRTIMKKEGVKNLLTQIEFLS